MALVPIDRNPSPRDLRWFGLVVLAFFTLLGGVLFFGFASPRAAAILAATGASLCALYYAVRPLRRSFFALWMTAAYPLAWLLSHALLAAIYYGVLTPIGLALRLSNRDALRLGVSREAKSYWTRHEPRRDIPRYFRQY